MWYLGGADSESGFRFSDFQPQNLFLGKFGPKCPFCLKIGTHGILEELIMNPELDFRNSNPKILFRANLSQKSISCFFLFDTFLLFLDIQLVLVLYYNIVILLYILPPNFTGSSENRKHLYFYFIVYCGYKIYTYNSCVLVPTLSKFIFTSFCSILTILGFWVWYPFSTS